jgi:hypothetical protein
LHARGGGTTIPVRPTPEFRLPMNRRRIIANRPAAGPACVGVRVARRSVGR